MSTMPPSDVSDPGRETLLGMRRDGVRDPGEILAAQLVEADMADADMARRLRTACGGESWACAGQRLGLRAETVRRVCQSGRPTARFMVRLCRAYGIDGHWLLTGEGSPYLVRRDAESLRSVPSDLLIAEVASRLGRAMATLEGVGRGVESLPVPTSLSSPCAPASAAPK